MGEKYHVSFTFPVTGAEPPPGLLLSLGDGTAIEAPDEMIRQALVKYDSGRPTSILDARVFRDILIQQAQEAARRG